MFSDVFIDRKSASSHWSCQLKLRKRGTGSEKFGKYKVD